MTQTYRSTRARSDGFTLVEILVYVAVLVLIASALVVTFLSLDTTIVRNKVERELTHSAQASMERLIREIRAADGVDTGLSTLGATSSVLVLDAGATTTRFYLEGGRLVVSVNGNAIGPLTGNEVIIQSFTADRYTTATVEMVRVALTLSVDSKAASSTRTYYGAGVLRGSYE